MAKKPGRFDMTYSLKSKHLDDYLRRTDIVDFDDERIIVLAERFRTENQSEKDLIRSIYEFVRNEIKHSADVKGRIITCRASDVLKAGEGICFAKSHLLAALLRCNGIPTGFCYQFLRLDDDDSPLILHGLNAVYMKNVDRWIRLDARGNKPGVDARFSIDTEQLAFVVRTEKGERDIPMIYTDPDANVISALTLAKSFEELWSNLPSKLAC